MWPLIASLAIMRNADIVSSEAIEKITQERLEEFDDASVEILAHRLEEDDYPTPFAGLQDWHLLRALAIHRPELTLNYHHLLDQEPFDED